MSPLGPLAPRRELLVPTLVVAAPLLYFLYRAVSIRLATGGDVGPRDPGLAAGAVLLSYVAASLFVAGLESVDVASHPGLDVLLRPGDGPLLVVLAVGLLVAGYHLATLLGEVPEPVEAVAAPVGLFVGLPLVVLHGATVVVGDALGREPAGWLQYLAVGLGVALSVLWAVVFAHVPVIALEGYEL